MVERPVWGYPKPGSLRARRSRSEEAEADEQATIRTVHHWTADKIAGKASWCCLRNCCPVPHAGVLTQRGPGFWSR